MELSTQADLELRDVTRLATIPTPTAEDDQLKVACAVLVPTASDAAGSITVQAVLMDSTDAVVGSAIETTLTLSTDAYTPGESLNTEQSGSTLLVRA